MTQNISLNKKYYNEFFYKVLNIQKRVILKKKKYFLIIKLFNTHIFCKIFQYHLLDDYFLLPRERDENEILEDSRHHFPAAFWYRSYSTRRGTGPYFCSRL